MVGCAVWFEEFFEEVFLGFGWMFLIFGGCAWASHTPAPSREGRLEC